MENNYAFGNYIAELRKKKNLSQAELGVKLGISNKAVSKWENGAAYPSTELILPLAKALDVSVEELFSVMSAAKQEKTRLRRFLDKIFSYSKIEYAVLAAIGVVTYILFWIFGDMPEKTTVGMIVPFFAAVVFGVLYFGLYISVRSPLCPMRFFDVFEVFILGAFCFTTVNALIIFFSNMAENYILGIPAALSGLAALIFFHNNRKK